MPDEEDDDERGLFTRHPLVVIGGFVVVAAGLWYAVKDVEFGQAPPPKAPDLSMVRVQLPPPPPPPPPPPKPPENTPPPPEQQEMIEQTPIEDETPPEPEAADDPAPDLGTNIAGDGPPDGFGLSRSGGTGRVGGTPQVGGGSRSRWGWYAAQVQTKISDALRRHPRTRQATLSVQVRVWPDATGRITRAQLAGSTGDRAIDDIITHEILIGLQLTSPPPADLPTPIVLRLTARRPN